MSLDDCWEMVETAEKTGRHCQMMENCCYDRIELMTLNLVRQGFWARCCTPKPATSTTAGGSNSPTRRGLWRRAWARSSTQPIHPRPRPGGPMHEHQPRRRLRHPGLLQQPDRGLHEYAVATFGPIRPGPEKFVLGDVNTSLIRTKLGKTIILIHDTTCPVLTIGSITSRDEGPGPQVPDRIYVEARRPSPMSGRTSPVRRRIRPSPVEGHRLQGRGGGHGGMDYIETIG